MLLVSEVGYYLFKIGFCKTESVSKYTLHELFRIIHPSEFRPGSEDSLYRFLVGSGSIGNHTSDVMHAATIRTIAESNRITFISTSIFLIVPPGVLIALSFKKVRILLFRVCTYCLREVEQPRQAICVRGLLRLLGV